MKQSRRFVFTIIGLLATVMGANARWVMVGGAAMYPSKNSIENAVSSNDHTTLVAAIKAAGPVGTLAGKRLFTVFAPENAAFDKLPEGTVENLIEAGKQGDA